MDNSSQSDVLETPKREDISSTPAPRSGSTHSLAKNASLYLGGNLVQASIPFLLLPLLTRYLTPAEFGQVAMFKVLVVILSAFTGLSVHGWATRKYFDLRDDPREYAECIGACWQLLLFTGAGVLLIVAMLLPWLRDIFGLGAKWILIAVALSVSEFVCQVRLGQWQVRRRPLEFAAFQVTKSAINGVASVILIVCFLLASNGRIAAQVFATFVCAALALRVFRRERLLSIKWRPDLLADAVGYGVPLIPHVIGSFALLTADRLIVKSIVGLDAAGIYMAALQFGLAIPICLTAVNQAIMPWQFEILSDSDASQRVRVVRLVYGYIAVIGIVGGCLSFVGPYIIQLVVGDEFHEAGEIFRWVAVGQSMHGVYLLFGNLVFFAKKTWLISSITGVSGIVNVGLAVVLVHQWGATGAAIAFACTTAIRIGLAICAARACVPLPWRLGFTSWWLAKIL